MSATESAPDPMTPAERRQVLRDELEREKSRRHVAEAQLAIAAEALRRLALIDEMAGMGQRDGDPELTARCRHASTAGDGQQADEAGRVKSPVEALAHEMYYASWQSCRAAGLFVIRWEDLADAEQPRPDDAIAIERGWLAAARVAQGRLDALAAESERLRARLEGLAAHWEREYASETGWPSRCARELRYALEARDA